MNTLATNNFRKVGLVHTFNTVNKYGIIGVSESYLNFSFSKRKYERLVG